MTSLTPVGSFKVLKCIWAVNWFELLNLKSLSPTQFKVPYSHQVNWSTDTLLIYHRRKEWKISPASVLFCLDGVGRLERKMYENRGRDFSSIKEVKRYEEELEEGLCGGHDHHCGNIFCKLCIKKWQREREREKLGCPQNVRIKDCS